MEIVMYMISGVLPEAARAQMVVSMQLAERCDNA